jgi:hypothetical protein
MHSYKAGVMLTTTRQQHPHDRPSDVAVAPASLHCEPSVQFQKQWQQECSRAAMRAFDRVQDRCSTTSAWRLQVMSSYAAYSCALGHRQQSEEHTTIAFKYVAINIPIIIMNSGIALANASARGRTRASQFKEK